MVGMERSHHPIPPAEMRGVIAAEELMMLIVMGDADERRWRPAPSTTMLVAGMADHASDLIIDFVREQHRGGDRYQHMGEEPIRLQEKIVDQAIAIVGPNHRRDRQMVPAMHAPIKKPGVNQSMQPIEPGVEQHERGDDRDHCPEDARQGPKSPAERRVAPMTAAEHYGDDRQRNKALPTVATDLRHRRLPRGLDFDSAAVQSRDNQASDQIRGEQSGIDGSNGRQQRTELSQEHTVPRRRCSHADGLCATPMVSAMVKAPDAEKRPTSPHHLTLRRQTSAGAQAQCCLLPASFGCVGYCAATFEYGSKPNGRIKPILREIIGWQDANGYPLSFATEVSAGARCATAIPT